MVCARVGMDAAVCLWKVLCLLMEGIDSSVSVIASEPSNAETMTDWWNAEIRFLALDRGMSVRFETRVVSDRAGLMREEILTPTDPD